MSVCLSVCVCACVFVCVCVCVCVCPSTVKGSPVWIRRDTREQINDVMLKTLNPSAGSLHRYFRMQNVTFQLSALSHTRSGQSHDLTTARLALKILGPSFTIQQASPWVRTT